MTNVTFDEFTNTVTTLSYSQQLVLLDVLKKSTSGNSAKSDPRVAALNNVFGILSHQDAQEIRDNKVSFNKDF